MILLMISFFLSIIVLIILWDCLLYFVEYNDRGRHKVSGACGEGVGGHMDRGNI